MYGSVMTVSKVGKEVTVSTTNNNNTNVEGEDEIEVVVHLLPTTMTTPSVALAVQHYQKCANVNSRSICTVECPSWLVCSINSLATKY